MDPDLTPARAQTHESSVVAHVTQVCMGPLVAQPSDTNMTTGGGPDPGDSCDFQGQHELRHSP